LHFFFSLKQTLAAIFSSKLTNPMAATVLRPGRYLVPYNSGIYLARRAAMGALCYQLFVLRARGWGE